MTVTELSDQRDEPHPIRDSRALAVATKSFWAPAATRSDCRDPRSVERAKADSPRYRNGRPRAAPRGPRRVCIDAEAQGDNATPANGLHRPHEPRPRARACCSVAHGTASLRLPLSARCSGGSVTAQGVSMQRAAVATAAALPGRGGGAGACSLLANSGRRVRRKRSPARPDRDDRCATVGIIAPSAWP